jgi:hypothetical protein
MDFGKDVHSQLILEASCMHLPAQHVGGVAGDAANATEKKEGREVEGFEEKKTGFQGARFERIQLSCQLTRCEAVTSLSRL